MESDVSQILIQLMTGLLYSIPTIIFIIISVYYLIKMGPKTDGIFILIGNIIILLSIIAHQVLFLNVQNITTELFSWISAAINIFSFLGSTLFVIGIFLLIKRVIKTKSFTDTIVNPTHNDGKL